MILLIMSTLPSLVIIDYSLRRSSFFVLIGPSFPSIIGATVAVETCRLSEVVSFIF
jgi:hypothetical protein